MSWRLLNVGLDASAPASIAPANPFLAVFPATREGEEAAGRFTIEAGAQSVGRIAEARLEGDGLVVRRTAFGGRVELETRHGLGRFVATANEPIEGGESVMFSASPGLAVERIPTAGGEVALEGARLVIGGGRGLDEEDFRHLAALAARLDGALGGSLPAVDLGLLPVARQIGQSGKFVSPVIYLAVGLSGTPQHLAGIGAATRIIAINKDPAAPIFRYSEAGAVGDAKMILPALLAALSREEVDA